MYSMSLIMIYIHFKNSWNKVQAESSVIYVNKRNLFVMWNGMNVHVDNNYWL